MRLMCMATIFGALAVVGVSPDAESQTRVRGNIAAVDGQAFSVKSADGQNVDIQLGPKTEIVYTQPIKLADIKLGDFLGVTSMKRDDGTLTAYEVRRFSKPLNPGHRPFDGKSDQTMTNASVSAVVQATTGRELTLVYDGGSQKIVVPENASISMLVPGEVSHLKPSAPVNLTANPGPDGKLTALRIQVGPAK